MKTSDLVSALEHRLPELEWKLNEVRHLLSAQHLPKSLFRTREDINGTRLVAELREDLITLSQQSRLSRSLYLAEQVQRKINILVGCYQHFMRQPIPENKTPFGLEKLSTRQQRIVDLEQEIDNLEQQRQAMERALAQINGGPNQAAAHLQLQADIGKISQRITLAREHLTQIMN